MMGFKRKEGARGAQGCILIHSTEMTQNVYKRGALAPNLVPEPFFLHPLTMLTIEDLKNAFGMQIDVTEFEKRDVTFYLVCAVPLFIVSRVSARFPRPYGVDYKWLALNAVTR